MFHIFLIHVNSLSRQTIRKYISIYSSELEIKTIQQYSLHYYQDIYKNSLRQETKFTREIDELQ